MMDIFILVFVQWLVLQLLVVVVLLSNCKCCHRCCCARRRRRPRRPLRVRIGSIKELAMDRFQYTFVLPALGATDVVKREIFVTINGVQEKHEVAADVTEWNFIFDEGAAVSMYLVDIDNADNHSANGELLEFTVTDTVPPPAPLAPTVSNVAQV